MDHHQLQLAVLDALRRAGGDLAIGVEWFQSGFQPVLDDLSGRPYRRGRHLAPQQATSSAGASITACIAPSSATPASTASPCWPSMPRRELTGAISQHGLDALPAEFRTQLPVVLRPLEHRIRDHVCGDVFNITRRAEKPAGSGRRPPRALHASSGPADLGRDHGRASCRLSGGPSGEDPRGLRRRRPYRLSAPASRTAYSAATPYPPPSVLTADVAAEMPGSAEVFRRHPVRRAATRRHARYLSARRRPRTRRQRLQRAKRGASGRIDSRRPHPAESGTAPCPTWRRSSSCWPIGRRARSCVWTTSARWQEARRNA